MDLTLGKSWSQLAAVSEVQQDVSACQAQLRHVVVVVCGCVLQMIVYSHARHNARWVHVCFQRRNRA